MLVTIYGRGFGFILIILLLVGFYIQKSYVRFSYTFDRLDFWYWHISFVVIIQYDFWATKESDVVMNRFCSSTDSHLNRHPLAIQSRMGPTLL